MALPIYLNVEHGSTPLFRQLCSTSIKFNDTIYNFLKIYQPNETNFSELKDSSILFMGPSSKQRCENIRQVLNQKLQILQPTQVTAFEVIENKYMIDLLDHKSENKSEESMVKVKLDYNFLDGVLAQRAKTNHTNSCLVINLYCNGKRFTLIDFGNEIKEENTTLSSIASFLRTKIIGRSSDLITSLILKSRSLKIVLNLGANDDFELTKLTLDKIVDLTKTFKLASKASRITSYTKPTSTTKLKTAPKSIRRPGSIPRRKAILAPKLSQPAPAQQEKPCIIQANASLALPSPDVLQLQLELTQLKNINSSSQAVLDQHKEILNGDLLELKSSLNGFKSKYDSLKFILENVKVSICNLTEENLNLKDMNAFQSAEIIAAYDELNFLQIDNSNLGYNSLQYDFDAIQSENKLLERSLIEKESQLSEKEVMLLEYTKELSEKNLEIQEKNTALQDKDAQIEQLLRMLEVQKCEPLSQDNIEASESDHAIEIMNLTGMNAQLEHEKTAVFNYISEMESTLSGVVNVNQSNKIKIEELTLDLTYYMETLEISTIENQALSNQLSEEVAQRKAMEEYFELAAKSEKAALEELEARDDQIDDLECQLDYRSEEIATLLVELKSVRMSKDNHIEDLNDEIANQLVTMEKQEEKIDNQLETIENRDLEIEILFTDRENIDTKLIDLKDQLSESVAWKVKYDNEIEVSKFKLVFSEHSPLNQWNPLVLSSPFDPSGSFKDYVSESSDGEYKSLDSSPKYTSKKVSSPTKLDNYKAIVSSMSKEKNKMKRKVKSQRVPRALLV